MEEEYPEIALLVVASIVANDEIALALFQYGNLLHKVIQIRIGRNDLNRNYSIRLLVARFVDGPIGATLQLSAKTGTLLPSVLGLQTLARDPFLGPSFLCTIPELRRVAHLGLVPKKARFGSFATNRKDGTFQAY